MSIVNLKNQILEIEMKLKDLEHQGNEIYDEFSSIGKELKLKEIHPPYNKENELQNKYMELDKQIYQIDAQIQELKEAKRKLEEKLYIENQKYLLNIYSNKKYKVRTFSENGHVDIYTNDFKQYTNVDKDIVVTKLIKDGDSLIEVGIYSKDYTKLKQIIRWYYLDDRYICQEVQARRLDESIINRCIYRKYANGSNMITFFKMDGDTFFRFNKSKLSVIINNGEAKTKYGTLKSVKGITQEGQEIIKEVLNKLKNDKYVDFTKEYELAY